MSLSKILETREKIIGEIDYDDLEDLIIEKFRLDAATVFDWGTSSVTISSDRFLKSEEVEI